MGEGIIVQEVDEKYDPKGKSVALVGPAAYMQGTGYGKEIDSHDLVVRINRGIESIDEFHNDIGKRTDIYYSCLIERAQQTGKLDAKELKERYGIGLLFAPPDSDMKGISTATIFHCMVDTNAVQKINSLVPIRLINHDFHTNLAKAVDCKPNTGFLSIYHLLGLGVKSLSIYGFSFYLDGFIPGQKSGVEKEKNCTEQEFADMAYKSKRHVQKNMWQFAKNTLLGDETVRLDPILEQILKLEKLDRDLFNYKLGAIIEEIKKQ